MQPLMCGVAGQATSDRVVRREQPAEPVHADGGLAASAHAESPHGCSISSAARDCCCSHRGTYRVFPVSG